MIGQNLTFTANSKIYRDTYSSTVLDMKDNMMTISIPYHGGLVILPGVGTRLSVNVNSINCRFDCEILERNIVKKYLKVSTPNSIARSSGVSSQRATKVIAVTSGKGGVGKTCFAINLAIALSQLEKKVLLFDADLGMANVDVLLNIRPEFDILDVISGGKEVKDIMIDSPGGFKFIPGASGLQQLAYLSDSQFNRIISGFNEVGGDFDYMLIDTGAGLSKNVTDFLLASDEVHLITTTEPHAIMDAYSIIKVMTDLEANKKISAIINRCESSDEAFFVLDKMKNTSQRFLNVDINYLGYILEDKNMSKSVKSQLPILLYSPDSQASKCIRSIAKNCIGAIDAENRKSGISGFLKRLKKLF